MNQRTPRLHDEGYLAYLRKMPCMACGAFPPCDAAHIKSASSENNKPSSGTAKPDDRWAVSLCRSCHLLQHHHGNELGWWAKVGGKGRDPFVLAKWFYALYGGTGGEPKKQRRVRKRKPRDQRAPIQTPSQRQRKVMRSQSKLKGKKIPSRQFPTIARPFGM